MDGINATIAPILLEQQVQINIVNKAMDTQQQSADALIKAMQELPQAQDPFRGQIIDFSV